MHMYDAFSCQSCPCVSDKIQCTCRCDGACPLSSCPVGQIDQGRSEHLWNFPPPLSLSLIDFKKNKRCGNAKNKNKTDRTDSCLCSFYFHFL